MAKSASKSFKLKRAYELAFSPDAKVVATIGRDVIFWSTATRKRLLSVHPLSHPSHIDFSPDGASLAIKSTSGRIVILDAAKGRIVTDCANPIALSPSATRLAVFYGAPPDPLEVIDVPTGRVLASAHIGSGGSGHSLAWSPDESMLGCVVDGGISLFDSSSLRRTHMIPLSYPAFVTFSADQRFLGLGSWNDSRVLDMSELAPFEVHANAA